jgi:hypothetical protein
VLHKLEALETKKEGIFVMPKEVSTAEAAEGFCWGRGAGRQTGLACCSGSQH